jgi:hypothetical protein
MRPVRRNKNVGENHEDDSGAHRCCCRHGVGPGTRMRCRRARRTGRHHHDRRPLPAESAAAFQRRDRPERGRYEAGERLFKGKLRFTSLAKGPNDLRFVFTSREISPARVSCSCSARPSLFNRGVFPPREEERLSGAEAATVEAD